MTNQEGLLAATLVDSSIKNIRMATEDIARALPFLSASNESLARSARRNLADSTLMLRLLAERMEKGEEPR